MPARNVAIPRRDILLPAGASPFTGVKAASARRVIEKQYRHLTGEAERLRAAEEENTLFALENLQTYPCVQARMVDGSLRVHAWFCNIATADLYACDPESNQFEPLDGVSPPRP